MANYLITCVIKCDNPLSGDYDPNCHHITDVGIESVGRQTVKYVIGEMDGGNSYDSDSSLSSQRPQVRKIPCNRCGYMTLKSHVDGTTVNNLDNLPACT